MPGPLQAGNELGDAPAALDQEVRRDAHTGEVLEIGMGGVIKAAGEELPDAAGGKLAGGQTDVVNDQQGNIAPLRPRIEMRRWTMLHPVKPAAGRVNPHGHPYPDSKSTILGRSGHLLQVEPDNQPSGRLTGGCRAAGAGCRSPTPAHGRTAGRWPTGGCDLPRTGGTAPDG